MRIDLYTREEKRKDGELPVVRVSRECVSLIRELELLGLLQGTVTLIKDFYRQSPR